MPSATNILMLEKFGLIEDWLGRNGGNGQHPQGARQGGNDRIARTSEHAGSERRVSWLTGYILCRHPEGRRPGLSADVHRYLRQGRPGQTLQNQETLLPRRAGDAAQHRHPLRVH